MRETKIYDPYRFVQAYFFRFRQLAAFTFLRSQPSWAFHTRQAKPKAFFYIAS